MNPLDGRAQGWNDPFCVIGLRRNFAVPYHCRLSVSLLRVSGRGARGSGRVGHRQNCAEPQPPAPAIVQHRLPMMHALHVGALHAPPLDELDDELDELDELELDEVFPSSPVASSPVASSPASSVVTPLLLLGSPLLDVPRPPSRGESPGPLVAHENTNPVASNTIPPAVRRPPKRMG